MTDREFDEVNALLREHLPGTSAEEAQRIFDKGGIEALQAWQAEAWKNAPPGLAERVAKLAQPKSE